MSLKVSCGIDSIRFEARLSTSIFVNVVKFDLLMT